MPINNCLPASVYGPVPHTLFMGASVVSCSLNLGYGDQSSTLAVELVNDPCPVEAGGNPKVYYDSQLNRLTTTDENPGFFPAAGYSVIGCPAYFRWDAGEVNNGFEWCGIIKSWQEIEGSNGNRFTVNLVDPREILEGVQLIVGNYGGGVDGYNIFNVYGFMESFGVPCPQVDYGGAVWGTPAGGFGGANVNENGMPWNRILAGLKILSASYPKYTNMWSPYGRVIFKGSDIAGYGLFVADALDLASTQEFPGTNGYLSEYFLDLSELPTTPSYWRFPGPTISLLEAVSQICEDAGCDYYVDLVPVKLLGGILKVIKFRVVSRRDQLNINSISQFLSANNALETQKGRELRNEPTTSMVLGGYKQHIYQAEQDFDPEGDGLNNGLAESDDVITPFWGLDQSGNAIISTGLDHNGTQFSLYIKPIHNQIPELSSRDNVDITVGQLRAALLGQDSWESYISLAQHPFATGLGIDGLYTLAQTVVSELFAGHQVANDWLINQRRAVYANLKDKRDKINLLYKWVYSYADTYYGKKFMVRLPFSCGYIDSESGKEYLSEEPSDGGWSNDDGVLGLPNFTIWTDFFKLDDGRFGPFCYFGNVTGADFSKLEPENYIFFSGARYVKNTNYNSAQCIQGGDKNANVCKRYIPSGISGTHIYIKSSIEDKLVYRDYNNRIDPRVVINTPDRVTKRLDTAQSREKLLYLIDLLLTINSPGSTQAQRIEAARFLNGFNVGSVVLNEPGDGTIAILPDAIAVPLKSNVDIYGPWQFRGPAGAVKIEQDENLEPWQYGGDDILELAGEAKVTESVTFQQVLERGTISVAGFPNIPLGAELGAIINGFFTANNHLVENRYILTETLSETFAGQQNPTAFNVAYIQFGQWDGTNGPNISALDIQIQGEGISTTYNFQTFTPKFGRFSKNNAQRLRQIGNLRLKAQRDFRKRGFINAISNLRKHGGGPKFILPPSADKTSTPSKYLIAQQINFQGKIHNEVLLQNCKQITTEMETGIYPTAAIMSLDGLFRPVSMSGDGGLPRYATLSGTICSTNSANVQPPVIAPTDGNAHYNLVINRNFLNPLTNPGSTAPFSSKYEVTPNDSLGHDIDFVARNTIPPTSHHSMKVADSNETYFNDYRFLAQKGPIVMHGWGYDTNGKPIPNSNDTDAAASGGRFVTQGLTDYFLDDFLSKPHTWPVAPIDLRFDRARGVWVSPPPYKLIRGKLLGDLPAFGSTSGRQIAGADIFTDNGVSFTPGDNGDAPTFTINDVVGIPLRSGNYFVGYYDTDDCGYYVIQCIASGTSGVQSSGLQIAGSGCLSGLQSYFPVTRIAFGTGLLVKNLGLQQASIELNFGLTQTTDCSIQTPFGFSSKQAVKELNIYRGLQIGDSTSCGASLALDFKVRNLSGCSRLQSEFTHTNLSGQNIIGLIFGTGLKVGDFSAGVASETCFGGVELDLRVQRVSGCFGGNGIPIASEIGSGTGLSVPFTRLGLLSGIVAYTGANCRLDLGLDLVALKITGCPTGQGFVKLNGGETTSFIRWGIGNGLALYQDQSNNCIAKLALDLEIQPTGAQFTTGKINQLTGSFSRIIIGSGLSIYSGSTCNEIKLGVDNPGSIVGFATGCVTGVQSGELNFSRIAFASGISFQSGDRTNEIKIGLELNKAVQFTDQWEVDEDLEIFVNSSGSCKPEIFINADQIFGYAIGNYQVLGHAPGGQWQWFDVSGCSG